MAPNPLLREEVEMEGLKKPLPILLCMTGDSMTSRFNRIGVGKLKLNSKEELIRPETTAEAK